MAPSFMGCKPQKRWLALIATSSSVPGFLGWSRRLVKVAALIVAAGRGHRFGGEVPKQYYVFRGEPILRHTQKIFIENALVDSVITVIHAGDRALYNLAADGLELLPAVDGGTTRQASVLNGLEALVFHEPDVVLIHDGCRPFVTDNLVSNVIDQLERYTGVVPGIPVADTLKRVENRRLEATVDRTGLWRVQTPQGFRFSAILEAHRRTAGMNLTDDAAVAECAGLDVVIIDGTEKNIKITMPEDLAMLDHDLGSRMEYRTGQGFDVHRFEAGTHLQLCGISISHNYGLAGHSDADVGLHALTDALLGAAGSNDIGEYFPPSDPQWASAESSIFVSHAVKLIEAMNGQIVNVDITLICETPKIKPHREAMRAAIGEMLGLEINRVSVKATTTEMLGFTGRQEGIAAQAIATICLQKEI